MVRRVISATAALFLLFFVAPAHAQALPEGQGEPEYRAWLAEGGPGLLGRVLSFEAWQDAAGVRGVLPTWQVLRTASMWRECGGQPFEIPPHNFWPDMVSTLKFIRDRIKPALGEVEAVSGYRNPALNACARGTERSAHLDYFALDLVPVHPLDRRELFRRLCVTHATYGERAGAGLGFYTFQRFHIDTRGFRRWGSAGPQGNESPCAVLERGGDPLAPPLSQPVTTTRLPVRTPPPRPAPTPYRPVPTTPPAYRPPMPSPSPPAPPTQPPPSSPQ